MLAHGLQAGDLVPGHPVEALPGWEGFYAIDASRAIGKGLSFRLLEETLRDTFLWDETRGNEALKAGLSPERERELLEAWRATQFT